MTHVVVDPVTRIEGHLRIEAEVDGGAVNDAWSSSPMFRGIELILKGRDPRDAWVFTQRICGVCTTVHAIASVRAVENALCCSAIPAALAQKMSMHQLGLQDLLAASTLRGTLPERVVLWGMEPSQVGWGTELSPEAEAALPRLVDAAAEELREWGAEVL